MKIRLAGFNGRRPRWEITTEKVWFQDRDGSDGHYGSLGTVGFGLRRKFRQHQADLRRIRAKDTR